MKKPLINRYDITISPDNNPLIQKTLEVDAIDMDAACALTRFVFRNSVLIVSITAHRERKVIKINPVIKMFEHLHVKCAKLDR